MEFEGRPENLGIQIVDKSHTDKELIDPLTV
jgi:hypothetical protein